MTIDEHGNGNGNGVKRPTTDQRRAMANLAEEVFTKRIHRHGIRRASCGGDHRRPPEGTRVDALDHKIKTLEDQVKILEKKRETLGWELRAHPILQGEQALKGRVSQQSTGVKQLEAERKKVLAAIWTCDTLDELTRPWTVVGKARQTMTRADDRIRQELNRGRGT